MNILGVNYTWKQKLTTRNETEYIVLHHAAMNGGPETIHQAHLDKGWAGIGYHFYVRKNGAVYKGRPIDKMGAHCYGHNQTSIGVCFEGNFENEQMCEAQVKAGRELVQYLKKIYPKAEVAKHRDLSPTACPGRNFPFSEILKEAPELTTANDITWELSRLIKIENVDNFVAALDKAKQENSPLYWGYYKIVNK